MTFGKYFIGQFFTEISRELTEISDEEYSVLIPSFSDEKIFHGAQINFCECMWDSVIGVTQGKVYKISLQTQVTKKNYSPSTDDLWNRVYEKLNSEYEIYTDQQLVGDSFVTTWNTKFGNIILSDTMLPNANVAPLTSESIINITLTGKFAFRTLIRTNQISNLIYLIGGIIISQFVHPAISVAIFLVLGLTFGRKLSRVLRALFLNGRIKNKYVFLLCSLWGATISFGIKALFLIYNPNMLLQVIIYFAGAYLSLIFYRDTKINPKQELMYGSNFKVKVNSITLLTYLISSILFYFFFK